MKKLDINQFKKFNEGMEYSNCNISMEELNALVSASDAVNATYAAALVSASDAVDATYTAALVSAARK